MTTVAAPTKFQQLRLKNNTPTAAPMPLLAGADGKVKYAVLASEGPVAHGGPMLRTFAFSFVDGTAAQTLTPQHLCSGLLVTTLTAARTWTTPTAQEIINFFGQELMPVTSATMYSYMGTGSSVKTASAGLPLLTPCIHMQILRADAGAFALTITGGTGVTCMGSGADIPVVNAENASFVSVNGKQKIDVFFFILNPTGVAATAKVGFIAF